MGWTASGWTRFPICTNAKAPIARTCRRRTQYLRGCAKQVDETIPDRMLLAEANQWPEDVVDYFGDGDECHMGFHFPLMPRHVHGESRGETASDHGDHRADPAIPETASGRSSCATTTS